MKTVLIAFWKKQTKNNKTPHKKQTNKQKTHKKKQKTKINVKFKSIVKK